MSLQTAIAAEVRAVITEADASPALKELLLALVSRPGRVLAPRHSSPWPRFVVESCAAFNGDRWLAISAASAVELAVAAIDVVDDLVDDEWELARIPYSRALNAALALSWLAQSSLDRLSGRCSPDRIRRLGHLLARHAVSSCGGQDLDLGFEDILEVSEEQAYEMTRRKSGALVAMACGVGATLAIDDQSQLRLVADFGTHLGLVAQLLNDLAGVTGELHLQSDVRRHKKTLPIVYTLSCARDENRNEITEWYQGRGTENEISFRRAVRDLGGLHFAWLIAETHRREALAAVQALARMSEEFQPWRLRQLVPIIRTRPT